MTHATVTFLQVCSDWRHIVHVVWQVLEEIKVNSEIYASKIRFHHKIFEIFHLFFRPEDLLLLVI